MTVEKLEDWKRRLNLTVKDPWQHLQSLVFELIEHVEATKIDIDPCLSPIRKRRMLMLQGLLQAAMDRRYNGKDESLIAIAREYLGHMNWVPTEDELTYVLDEEVRVILRK